MQIVNCRIRNPNHYCEFLIHSHAGQRHTDGKFEMMIVKIVYRLILSMLKDARARARRDAHTRKCSYDLKFMCIEFG